MECKWKDQFCLPEKKFYLENGISWNWGRQKFPNGISEWKMCVPFASFYWFHTFWLGSLLILSSENWKVVEMERAHPHENFLSGFDASRLLQLWTNKFFCANGKTTLITTPLNKCQSRYSGLTSQFSARYDWFVARQSTSFPVRHWNLRNLTLQARLSFTRDFSACTLLSHSSIMLRLASLASSLGWLVGNNLAFHECRTLKLSFFLRQLFLFCMDELSII